MVQASQPEIDSSTGTMILGVQCACRVIPWKDGGYSIEPCPLHAVADDLLAALEAMVKAHPGGDDRDMCVGTECICNNARAAIEAAKS